MRLAPGESVTAERAVLNDEVNETCYPSGRYRFPVEYRWGNSATVAANETAASWGVALEISDLRPDE